MKPSRSIVHNDKKGMQKLLRNEHGIAMMLSITTVTVIAILTAELIYEVAVYQKVVNNTVDNLRAKYLARGALQLGRLQVHAANKALQKIKQIGKNSPVKNTDVNQIYNIPLILPPPLPSSATLVARSALDNFNEELGLHNSQVSVKLVPDSSKLNLNRLIWLAERKKDKDSDKDEDEDSDDEDGEGEDDDDDENSEKEEDSDKETEEDRGKRLQTVRATISETLQALMDKKFEDDEDFAQKYDSITADELVGNILAWIDKETFLDAEGAPKESFYSNHDPPYALKNAPLYSLSELHMVKGFDDELVEFVSQNFTAALTDGININRMSEALIQALFPSFNEDMTQQLSKHSREVGFSKIEDFWKYMQDEFEFSEDDKKELEKRELALTTTETAFRVLIEAKSGDARRVWVAQLGAAPPEQRKLMSPDEARKESKDNQEKTTSKNDNNPPPIVYLRTD